MLSQCLRCVLGIEVSDEALFNSTISEVYLNGQEFYSGNE